ncbi:MAG: hypothetical protein DHS20C21_04680 [Gemmatimonadota bacterium]|nr:MAG: hypothetical protein DHS20C21_04680 [Gemmatimonadota bacterium]
MGFRNSAALLAAVLVLLHATDAVAADKKAKVRPTGVKGLLGVVIPDDADAGLLIGGAANLGTVFQPWMHLTAGATRWSADIDPAAFSDRTGTLRDFRLFTSVGLELPPVSGVQGYVNLGLAAHFLDAKVPDDEDLADAISGTNIGAEIGYGLLSTAGSFNLGAEVRREFVDDASNWAVVFGIGTRWDKPKTGTTTTTIQR